MNKWHVIMYAIDCTPRTLRLCLIIAVPTLLPLALAIFR